MQSPQGVAQFSVIAITDECKKIAYRRLVLKFKVSQDEIETTALELEKK